MIELLVAVGLMAFVGTGVGIAIFQLVSSQNEISKKFDAGEFVAGLARSMTDRATCRSYMSGQSIPTNTDFTDLSITGYKGFGDSTSLPLKAGYLIAGTPDAPQVVVTDLSWRLKEPVTSADIFNMTHNGVTAGYFKAPMQLRVVLTTYVNGKATPLPPRYLDYSVLAVASNRKISDCAGTPSVEDTCTMIGSELNADGTCKISMDGCVIRGSYVRSFCYTDPKKIDELPSGIACRASQSSPSRMHPETKDYKCPKGASPFTSFNYSWVSEEKTGKKSGIAVTNAIQAYMCMSCK